MEMVTTFLLTLLILAIPIGFVAGKRPFVAVGSYLLFAFFAMAASIFLAFNFFLMSIVVVLVLQFLKVRPKLATSLMCLWSLALPITGMREGAREFRELHAEFPIESLTERLEYETRHMATTSTSDRDAVVASREWVQEYDHSYRDRARRDALERLHTKTFSQFVAGFGFGASRMTSIHSHLLRYDSWKSSPHETFPDRPRGVESSTTIDHPLQAIDIKAIRKGPPLPRQLEVVSQFTSDLGSAYVPSRQHAAGFRAHRLMETPALQGDEPKQWQISRLDLVSLLKFAEPRVYLSEHLPRMEELRNAETRPVDDFEQRALEQLRGGEEIVVDQQFNTIRMVGAVRAAKQCLDCHSVRRGDLLGAFSYLLDRKQPLPPPKAEVKSVSLRSISRSSSEPSFP